MATPTLSPSLRIVPGIVETKSTTTRLVIPTSAQPAWPPFVRVGETVASRARQFPAHSHEGEEVLTYVIDGFSSYQSEDQPPEVLQRGSARFLTASTKSSHRIMSARGGPIRWFNLVTSLPAPVAGAPRVQSSEPPVAPRYDEDAHVRPLVGPGSYIASAGGLEVAEIKFEEPATTFRRIGHNRRGVVYSIAGMGTVDGKGIESGEAALAEGMAGIAIQSLRRLWVIVATGPR